MERRFLVNVWCQNHRVGWIRDDAELRRFAEEMAHEWDTTVTFAEVIEGKVVHLGHVARVMAQEPPRTAHVTSSAPEPAAPTGVTRPRGIRVEMKREPPTPALVISSTPLPVAEREPPTPAEIKEYIERISLLD